MIHSIVHYVGNFIPNRSIVVNLCSETQSGIKVGNFIVGNFIPNWVGTKFFYIEETNSRTSVYFTNYMGNMRFFTENVKDWKIYSRNIMYTFREGLKNIPLGINFFFPILYKKSKEY